MGTKDWSLGRQEDEGRKIGLLALRKPLGQCPTLEDEPRGCGAALVAHRGARYPTCWRGARCECSNTAPSFSNTIGSTSGTAQVTLWVVQSGGR